MSWPTRLVYSTKIPLDQLALAFTIHRDLMDTIRRIPALSLPLKRLTTYCLRQLRSVPAVSAI